jgi:hypothetical protein
VVLAHVDTHTRVLGVYDTSTNEAWDAGKRWQVIHPDGWWSLISMTVEGKKA